MWMRSPLSIMKQIVVVSKPGIRVVQLSVKISATSFEHLCYHTTIDDMFSILVVMYRPGSPPPSSEFLES